MNVLEVARAYVAAGISIVPVGRDKLPAWGLLPREWDEHEGKEKAVWKPFQTRLPSEAELADWFHSEDVGLATIGGAVSSGLEQLDFDRDASEVFPAWCELVDAEQPGLSDSLHVVETPGSGYHVKYLCPDVAIPGNTDLALYPKDDPRKKELGIIIIQTRGEGGYCVAPGSPPICHPSGRLYRHFSGPRLPDAITPAQREILLRCARFFSRTVQELPRQVGLDLRPGDDYDRRGPDWSDILEPAGWKCVGRSGQERRWRRPGKDGPGWSATTGHCHGKDGADLLRIFSSNASPFEDGKAYGKFRTYALLNHGGDLSAAADELSRKEYGTRRARQSESSSNDHSANGHANGHAANGSRPPAEPLEVPLPPAEPWPEPPAAAAFQGVLGDILEQLAPQTEADPVAVLVQVLVMFGSVIGRHAHWRVESDRHYGNLYCCCVGDTAVGRKGVSLGRAMEIFAKVNDPWTQTRHYSGLSSGEGVIGAVRDPSYSTHQVKQRGRVVDTQQVMSDKGEEDKRLLVLEPEFARALAAMQRKGNTLSAVLRQGWDSGNLSSLTKNKVRATGAHISLICHITRCELRLNLAEAEKLNGYVNRFLWIATRRARLLPLGGASLDLGPLAHRVALAVEHAQLAEEIGLDEAATHFWCAEVYPRLNEPAEGLLGAILARGPAQVRRLAMLYALLDFADVVRLPHLLAAVALWDYCERSCRWVFDVGGTGDPNADEILAALRSAGPLGRTEINRQIFGGRLTPPDLTRALVLLRDRNLIGEEKVCPNGRTVLKFRALSENPARFVRAAPSTNGHNDLRPNS